MRSPQNDKTEGVKRFTYKGPNSSSDDVDNFQKSRTPLQSTHRSNVSSSDMEVIWSVRKDSSGFNSKMTSNSPTPMSGFYSRYTSQDPRFRSQQLSGNEKSDMAGVSGDYMYNPGKSGYSYSQGKMKMQPASEHLSPSNNWKQSQATHRNTSFRDSSPTTPSPPQESGRFNIPSTSSDRGRHSSNSWDDFF